MVYERGRGVRSGVVCEGKSVRGGVLGVRCGVQEGEES